jgi:hypothetical protein
LLCRHHLLSQVIDLRPWYCFCFASMEPCLQKGHSGCFQHGANEMATLAMDQS